MAGVCFLMRTALFRKWPYSRTSLVVQLVMYILDYNSFPAIETDSKKLGQDQKLTANKESSIFELSS